ncbi:hypothetical protein BI347_12895 [Chromobacterium sphagni]|uniref:NADPH-dependent FMN reductase-like domain-containing protein n=1 Tax=Chromobacterium sphagni TaxID=1903179 RepID=A0A1S1X484_9NEIS|nr:hypothetical protein BI347_12895 [Chromobacterium sphagni]OHX16296.1 hypothetical protein BI344_12810 [Chromobacterium sphagni]
MKNALDHLYREWPGKPAVIASYGGHGGGKCAAQLRQVADGLKMRVAATMPALELSEEAMRSGQLEAGREFAGQAATVEQAFDELASLLLNEGA